MKLQGQYRCKYSWLLLLFLLVSVADGLSVRLPVTRQLSSASHIILASTASSTFRETESNDDDDEVKAIRAVQQCAKITALSSLVDIGTYGWKWQGTGTVLTIFRSLWKAFFAFNIYRVSRFHQQVQRKKQDSNNNDANDTRQSAVIRSRLLSENGLPQQLQTMTECWRVTAIMVFLSAATNLVVEWQTHVNLSRLRESMIVTFLVIVTTCCYASHKDTEGIVAENNSTGHESDSLERITEQGVIMTRAMLMSASSFFVSGSFLFLIACFSLPKWQDTILGWINMTAPFVLAKYLYKLRGRVIEVLGEVSNNDDPQKQQSEENSTLVPPESLQKLSKAQQEFYNQVISALKADMIIKILFLVVSGKKSLEVLVTAFGNVVA